MRSKKFQTTRTVTNFVIFLLFIPFFLSGQPFSVKKKQMRFIEVNNFKYYDVHIVLNAKKAGTEFSIDSICFNNSYGLSYKLSVLGKDISTTSFAKRDSVLIQLTAPGAKKAADGCIVSIHYHYLKKPDKSKYVVINNIQLLDSIKFGHNQ